LFIRSALAWKAQRFVEKRGPPERIEGQLQVRSSTITTINFYKKGRATPSKQVIASSLASIYCTVLPFNTPLSCTTKSRRSEAHCC